MPVRNFAFVVAATFFVSSFFCGSAHAEACDFPESISIPDGNTATERQMTAAGLALDHYVDQMQAFAECVEMETGMQRRLATRKGMAEHKRREDKAANRQNNAADAIEQAIETYNKAMAAYMLRSK